MDRTYTFGWVHWKEYYKPCWFFSFSYYKNCVWQLRILGFYITSWNNKSIVKGD